MFFKFSDKQLLKKYNQIWKRVEKLLKIGFDSKPVYGDNDKYTKTKVKIYAGSKITKFSAQKIPKEKAPCKCLSIIMPRFCYQSKEKVLSSNNPGKMQI